MDAIKVGNFIKELRKNNKLTQKQFGEKYHVTYQAVSKWERGINIPDISLLREMSKDFNVSIEDILDGEVKEKEKKKRLIYPYIFGIVGFILLGLLVALLFLKAGDNGSDFTFKTLSTECEDFAIIGSIAYDKKKSSINIASVDYCGGDDVTVYDKITCELYEDMEGDRTLISKCNEEGENTNLEDYLKKVRVNVDNYEQMCKNYDDSIIYLQLRTQKDLKMKSRRIYLELGDNCPVEVKK